MSASASILSGAGNTAILKPSEVSTHTTELIVDLVNEIFDQDEVFVVSGGIEESTALLKLPFDHIYFTGSGPVGKIVMKAAAENLSSVTLELGGKSPVIVDETANLKDAAKRIVFGKFINNSQTCLAPDYILVKEEIENEFLQHIKNAIQNLFDAPDGIKEDNPHYARIITRKHVDRLTSLLQNAKEMGATEYISGTINPESKFFPPHVLTNVSWKSQLMEEEIFGPILPVLTYKDEAEIIDRVNALPKPLALYIFSNRQSTRKRILKETSSGTTCINDCVIHFAHPGMPFGGVNASGIGKSHGYYGFLAFTNEKPVLKQRKDLQQRTLFIHLTRNGQSGLPTGR
ncbi:MAG: aldehyde dehydrogenase family protein [Flammeovirgaceae bacterium]|nr:aldehyde dehydrogenase family protein [Flammeovirgaceae bacterium]